MGNEVEISQELTTKVWEAIWDYVNGTLGVNDVIKIVLSAVCDGEQGLPGEVGRFRQRQGLSVFKEGTAMRALWDGTLLIALRREEEK